MHHLEKYIISFGNLDNGEYTIDFNLDKKFFEHFETSEIENANLKAVVSFEKKDLVQVLNINISGTLQVECDRCLDMFDLSVMYEDILYVKYGNTIHNDDDEIIVVPVTENEINIAQYLYEFSVLSLPYKRVHPEDNKGESTCNPEMIKKLNEISLQESNESENNPWNDLKKLIN